MNFRPPVLKRSKLILLSFVLAAIPLIGTFVAIVYQPAYYILLFLLPFGLAAAVMARIVLGQIKRGQGSPEDFVPAIIAYYLGFVPALYFCGVMTYQLLTL